MALSSKDFDNNCNNNYGITKTSETKGSFRSGTDAHKLASRALGPVVWSGDRRRSRRRLWTLEVLILSSSFLQLHSSASTLGQPFPRLPSQARRCGFSLCLSRHAHPRHLCFRSQPVRFKLISNSFISVFCSLFGFRITSLRDPFISETIPFFIPL